jgi:molecular chaperone DnaK
MARDAESHASEDKVRKEEIELKNQGDQMLYNVDKMLKEHRSKIADADAQKVEEALANLRKAMEDGGKERIQSAIDQVNQASHKLAEAMYKAASPDAGPGPQESAPGQPPPGGPTDGAKPKENVVDAEFVDVDDKK